MRLFIVFLLLATIITAVMADSSLPGDKLYYARIYGNERVILAFSLGKQAKAESSLVILRQRVSDIRYLNLDPELVPELAPIIKKSIAERQADIETYVTAQEAIDPEVGSYNATVKGYYDLMETNQAFLSSFYRNTIEY